MAYFDIKLWKHYNTSTSGERDEHKAKWVQRFHKLKSGEANTSVLHAMSDYEVS